MAHHRHLLYLTSEQWPTFRVDVVTLFGKYLPRHGVSCDLVTERYLGESETKPAVEWPAGRTLLCEVPRSRAGQYVVKFLHQMRQLAGARRRDYQAIQVRDMALVGLVGLLIARMKGLRFFYWLSYPQSEGQMDRARSRGPKAGMRYWFPLLQGKLGAWVLYRWVLPCADHVFVQSDQMLKVVAGRGIDPSKMTPVPMGVDLESARPEAVRPIADVRLEGRRVLVYLGTLDPVRSIEVLFDMLARVREQIPEALLVLAGDTEDAQHRNWLRQEAERAGVAEHVIWTGWLPMSQAWQYVRAGEIGLSPCPRGYLLDMGSPTKAVEYLALGLPVVVNDNPDQELVVQESGAGLCVPLQPDAFARSVLQLLGLSDADRHEMGLRGRNYVQRTRSYERIAEKLASVYQQVLA